MTGKVNHVLGQEMSTSCFQQHPLHYLTNQLQIDLNNDLELIYIDEQNLHEAHVYIVRQP